MDGFDGHHSLHIVRLHKSVLGRNDAGFQIRKVPLRLVFRHRVHRPDHAQMALPKVTDGTKVRTLIGGQPTKGHLVFTRRCDFPRREHARAISVDERDCTLPPRETTRPVKLREHQSEDGSMRNEHESDES